MKTKKNIMKGQQRRRKGVVSVPFAFSLHDLFFARDVYFPKRRDLLSGGPFSKKIARILKQGVISFN
jgi:hypothetical protein